MESKDEASDTDSGVILQSGPDSPVSPLKELKELKEGRELTLAVRRQQRALEQRLEACLEELRRLCLREAELTGVLPAEYPLKPGEPAPTVRRRIGAAYRLDEQALRGEDPLSSLEQELALQLQIAEASRRLSREERLGRQARRQRKHAVLREEEKLRALQRCLGEQRQRHHRGSLPPDAGAGGLPLGRELSVSDDSSLSDGLLLEEEEAPAPQPAPASEPPSPEGPPPPAGPPPEPLDPAPIQNGPWKETSLDQPYEKPAKAPAAPEPGSGSSSTASTPQDGPSTSGPRLPEPPSFLGVPPGGGAPGPRRGRASAPATPTTPTSQGRRGQTQALRADSFRAGPRRRPTHYTVTVPSSCWPPSGPPRPPPAPHSCSEDSGSDASSGVSHATSPASSSPDLYALRPLSPPGTPGHRRGGAWIPAAPRPALLPPLPPPSGPPPFPGAPPFPAGRYLLVAEGRLPPPGGAEPDPGAPGGQPEPEEEEGGGGLARRLQPLQPLQPHRTPRGRLARAPSLRDCPAGRALSRAAVTQELQSWHQRVRLRAARPPSLDRQGAPRGRSLPPGRGLGPRAQVPAVCVLRRSPEGAPVQVFVPENGEIISQV